MWQKAKQVDMTDNDLLILLFLGIPVEPRKQDSRDASIMLFRTLARLRGANPAEIQRTVMQITKEG